MRPALWAFEVRAIGAKLPFMTQTEDAAPRLGLCADLPAVEPRLHSLARPELSMRSGWHSHLLASTRVPAGACLTATDAEHAEVARLDPIACRQCIANPIKDDESWFALSTEGGREWLKTAPRAP